MIVKQISKHIWLVFALLVTLVTAALSDVAHAANELKAPLRITFDVSTEGSNIGEYVMKLEETRNIFTVESTLTPKGIAQLFAGGLFEQRSRFLVRKGRVVPLVYTERREGNDPPAWTARFDWTRMSITLPDDKVIEIPRQPVDAATAPLQLMMTPPSKDRRVRLHVISDSGVRRHLFTLESEQQLDTALGKIDTLRIRQRKAGDDENKYVDIWLAPDRNFVPVKIVRSRKSRKIEFNIRDLKIGS